MKSNRIILISIFILSLLVIGLFNIDYHILILRDINTDELIYLQRVKPGDEFTMKWMHSVELQPWEEIFRIDKKYNIVLDRTRFKSFGAGVPDYAGNETLIEDGYVIFKGINTNMENLTYGISGFAKHTFYFKNDKLELYKLVNDADGINISVSNMNALSYYNKKIAAKF